MPRGFVTTSRRNFSQERKDELHQEKSSPLQPIEIVMGAHCVSAETLRNRLVKAPRSVRDSETELTVLEPAQS